MNGGNEKSTSLKKTPALLNAIKVTKEDFKQTSLMNYYRLC